MPLRIRRTGVFVSQPGPVPSYVGEHVQIGTGRAGMKPVAQNGRVVVADGSLQLFGSDGQLLDEAPVAAVDLSRGKGLASGLVWATIGPKRYSLAIGAGGPMLFTGLLRMVKGASGGKSLIAAVAAEQGTPGSK